MNSESSVLANQCNKPLLPADEPCVQLHPTPGQDNADESLQMRENKKSHNNFAVPVLSLEHFCCSLQAQNPGNVELKAVLDVAMQELLYYSRHPCDPIFSLEISTFADSQKKKKKSTKCLFMILYFQPHFSFSILDNTDHQAMKALKAL